MNKLREKFYKKLGIDCLTEQCEEITDDFSVKFYDWTLSDKGIGYAMSLKTTTELQQYFKENIYEKQ